MYELLEILADGKFHSGQKLGSQLQVSRASIWQTIKKFSELGLEIHSVRGKGYRLTSPLDLLKQESIVSSLGHEASSFIEELEVLHTTESTNSYVLERIQNCPDYVKRGKYNAVLAEYQTAGKGRRGRTWVSPFGKNIYLSLACQMELENSGIDGISLVSGLAVGRALKSLGTEEVGIKWPNDIVLNNKKLAGILLELQGDVTGVCNLVVGVGINVQCTEEEMCSVNQPWTDLSAAGEAADRNQLAGSLIGHLIAALEEFQQKGFTPFMEEWNLHDITLGQAVVISSSSRQWQGIAKGINNQGALLLDTGNGMESFSGGEVSLRKAVE